MMTAMYTAFTTPPKRSNEPWLHESLLHSIQVIAWGFFWAILLCAAGDFSRYLQFSILPS
ncbi:hypothetical protein THIOSC15_2640012 [uncultured Thiomicrorhabdus sp.]